MELALRLWYSLAKTAVCCISRALYSHTCCLLSMESKEEIYEIYTHRETGGGHLIDPACIFAHK